MPGFGEIAKKAFYLGVGMASYASEQATGRLGELRKQAQKLADELVARGEMTTEEARRMVDEMVAKAQQVPPTDTEPASQPNREPRRIEILDDEVEANTASDQSVDALRSQVEQLQAELRRLQKD